MAEALLRASPASRVLATSREPLRAEGEHVYQIPPLDVPAEDNLDMKDVLEHGAVKLFIARAHAARPAVRAGHPPGSGQGGDLPASRRYSACDRAGFRHIHKHWWLLGGERAKSFHADPPIRFFLFKHLALNEPWKVEDRGEEPAIAVL